MLLTHSSMDGLSVDYCLAGFYCARTGWAAGCRFSLGVLHIFPELGLEEWLLPKVCSSHLDSRSRTAGQKHCSERAVHFAHIPWRSHGMQCRPHGQAHSHGAERHGWKREKESFWKIIELSHHGSNIRCWRAAVSFLVWAIILCFWSRF